MPRASALASSHGAPFLPKVSQIAKGNLAFAVGLMSLLIVVTVIYLPLVLPLLLPGVSIDAGQIALSLFGLMLVPLVFRVVFPWLASRWRRVRETTTTPAHTRLRLERDDTAPPPIGKPDCSGAGVEVTWTAPPIRYLWRRDCGPRPWRDTARGHNGPIRNRNCPRDEFQRILQRSL